MRPITIFKQLVAADDDGICTAQTPGGAGDLTLDGALVSGGAATMDTQRRVSITATNDESGTIFTLEGQDGSGNTISEEIAGPPVGQVATELDFLVVTRVAVDSATAGNVEVGSHSSGSTPPIRLDQYLTPFQVAMSFVIDHDSDDEVNASVQYTLDENVNTTVGPFHYYDHGDIHLRTEDTNGTLISPASAVRLLVNSGVGLAELQIIQAGS